MRKTFIETGRIMGTHGVKGEMKIEVWSDHPEVVRDITSLYFDEGRQRIPIRSRRIHKNRLLMCVEGVDSMEKAEALRGRIIYLHRDDITLSDGAILIADLIGLCVLDGLTGEAYGSITDVLKTGANDVYQIEDGTGAVYLFPAVAHMIKQVNLSKGTIEVLPIPGIFDEGGLSDAN